MSVQATHSRYGVFLSFAGEQREIAERLRESCLLLLSECFGKEIVEEHEELLVFLDNITLEPGTRKKNLEKAVKGSNLFVALVSERFTEKEWPQKEVGWRKDWYWYFLYISMLKFTQNLIALALGVLW